MNNGTQMLDFLKSLADEEIAGYLAAAWDAIAGAVLTALLLIALLHSFFGYRIIKLWMAVCGFALGAYGGYFLGLGLWHGMIWFVVSLFCGVLAGFLTVEIRALGLFLVGVCLGLIGFYQFMNWPLWLSCVLAAVAGVLCLIGERYIFIVLTALSGAFGAAYSVTALLQRFGAGLGGRGGVLRILLAAVFCAAGAWVQWRTTGPEEDRGKVADRHPKRPEDGRLYRLFIRGGFGGNHAPLLSVMAMAVSAVPICAYLALAFKRSGEAHYIFVLLFAVLALVYGVAALRWIDLDRDTRHFSRLWPPMAAGWCVYYAALLILTRMTDVQNCAYYALALGSLCGGGLLAWLYLRPGREPLSLWFYLACWGAITVISVVAQGWDTWLLLELALRLGFCAIGVGAYFQTVRHLPVSAAVPPDSDNSEKEKRMEEVTQSLSGLFCGDEKWLKLSQTFSGENR